MIDKTKQSKCNFANFLLILTLIVSAILMFFIKLWIVLIINFCVNVIYRTLCIEMEITKWKVVLLYVIMSIISIGTMLIIMFNLDKISCLLQHKSDMKYIYDNLGAGYLLKNPSQYGWKKNAVNTDKLINFCYKTSGIMMTILIVHHIICGFILICFDDGADDIPGSICLAFPLLSLGALSIFYLPIYGYAFTNIFRWILSIGYIAVVEVLLTLIIARWYYGGSGGSSDSSGGSDTYYAIIFKE